jgi:hypothetical protein
MVVVLEENERAILPRRDVPGDLPTFLQEFFDGCGRLGDGTRAATRGEQ